jgi:hypothetical protein
MDSLSTTNGARARESAEEDSLQLWRLAKYTWNEQ